MPKLPTWANDLAEQYYGRTLLEFIVYGNVHDKVETEDGRGKTEYLTLHDFLGTKLFARRDAVLFYDPSNGISFRDEETHPDFHRVVQGVDRSRGTNYATEGLPRDANRALYLIEKYMRAKVDPRSGAGPKSVALVIEYADLVLPASERSHLSLAQQSTLVTLLRWAKDPVFLKADLTVVLVAESLAQLSPVLVESPFIGRVEVRLPDAEERLRYLRHKFEQSPELNGLSEVPVEQFAQLTGGLSLVNMNHVLSRAKGNERKITSAFVGEIKRELIEKECFGMIEFLTSAHGLEAVCGHVAQKEWLKEDARLIREGRVQALPMGYLICGPVGTGKSFLAQCYTHDIGIPCVQLKNFRSQWYGATESNWQKILSVLKATGPVGVVIDEADAALGDRSSGHEVSNRVFSMLATQMGDTRYRGHILWFLLTSRPDLLPVDIKRQGRAEVHIPLFYPDTPEERRQMQDILARKCKINLAEDANEVDIAMLVVGKGPDAEALDDDDLPEDAADELLEDEEELANVGEVAQSFLRDCGLSGAEIESILVRAMRRSFLNDREVVAAEDLDLEARCYIPNLSLRELELQVLTAVEECSDKRFLPERLANLDRGLVRSRCLAIKRALASHSDIREGGEG